MTPSQRLATVDFRRSPYKGIISEVAEEEGVSQPAISRRLARLNLETIALVMKKVDERERKARRFIQAKGEGDG